MDLLKKHEHLAERHKQMMQLGQNAVGIRMDEILSPTRAIVNGRETILAGTNNYMGITFNEACIEAGKKALDDLGTGTTGSRIANGSYAMHQNLERELAGFLRRKHVITFSTGLSGQSWYAGWLGRPKGYDLSRCGFTRQHL